MFAPVIFLMLFVMMFIVVISNSERQTAKSGGYWTNDAVPPGLTEFSYFIWYEAGGEGGYGAVLGDGGRAFGGYQYDYEYELQPFLMYCLVQDPVFYSPFKMYTQCPKSTLLGNRGLANAWTSVYNKDKEKFSRTQDKFAYEEKYLKVEAFMLGHGLDLSKRPDVIKGLVTSVHNRKGFELTAQYSVVLASQVTNSTSDADFIKKVCDQFGLRGGNIYQRYCVDGSSPALGGICEKNMCLAILNGNRVYVGGGTASETGKIPLPQREAFLFPNGYPSSSTEADTYIATIDVPINDGNGNKTTRSLRVHKKLAEDVKVIFAEMQKKGFKIVELGGQEWRTMASGTGSISHHSYGIAIDINWTVNPAVYWGYAPDKTSPYYINQDIVNIWKKHGWYWGGDWSPSYFDPMHFTYTNH